MTKPMKFAYADPPYLGMGRKLYSPFHAQADEYDDRQAHINLVEKLMSEYPDGWALSCNPKDLQWLLPEMPDDVRVCAWTKTFHQIRVNVSVQYAWEPVIIRGGRDMRHRRPMTRDWVSGRIAMKKGLPGAKPEYFFHWIAAILGYQVGDAFDDLFVGTGGMALALQTYGELLNI